MAGARRTFFKSTDAGANFSINPFTGQASTTSATYDLYGAHFLDFNNGFATGIGGVTKTTDGRMTRVNASGSTFPVSATGRKIYFRDANNGYVAGTSSIKLSTTTDGGATWDSMFTTNIQAPNDLDFLNPRFGVVADNGGNIWKTTDGGVSLTSISNQGSTVGLNAVNIISQDTIWVLGGGTSISKTADGGANWTNV